MIITVEFEVSERLLSNLPAGWLEAYIQAEMQQRFKELEAPMNADDAEQPR